MIPAIAGLNGATNGAALTAMSAISLGIIF
jgi:hypothetical protein